MAEGDVEFGHVVDLTLGEPSGTELVADAAIGATTLTVDYAGDFEDVGEVVLNGTTLAYTSIAYGAAETDPDVITLAAPLAAAAVVDDKVVRVSGGEEMSDWLLHVSLGDGHPVDIPIPFEQRALWSTVDPTTPVPVMVSADLERLVEVPGRTPVVDGALVDLIANNVLANAIDATDLTGTTITGALIRSAASGARWELTSGGFFTNTLKAYTGSTSETAPSLLQVSHNVNQYGILNLQSPNFGALGGGGAGPLRYSILQLISPSTTGSPSMANIGADIFQVSLGGGGGADALQFDSITGELDVPKMGDGSVGTGTFRDSVRAALNGNYAAAWTTYTPTFTASTTNPTLGSFTRAGRYLQVGKRVNFSVVITATAASGYGAGTYSFGLPVTARNADEVIVQARQTGPTHTYIGSGDSTTSVALTLTATEVNANATNTGMASGTVLRISGTYEAA